MKELLLSLIIWINQNTGFYYDPAAAFPEVRQVPESILVRMLLDYEVSTSLTAGQLESMEKTVAAIYDHSTRMILVGNETDLNTGSGRSVLVHELIHHIQYSQGMDQKASCIKALELDAYEVQRAYMEAHDIPVDFDPFTVLVRASCFSDV